MNGNINSGKTDMHTTCTITDPNLLSTSFNENRSRKNTTLTHNIYQFYTTSIVLCVDYHSNLYYKCLNNDRANQYVNIIVGNKYYSVVVASIIILLGIVSEIEKAATRQGHHSKSYLAVRFSATMLAMIYTTTILATANLNIIKIVLNTFEFWFKVWNAAIWAVSIIWINIVTTDRYVVDIIATILSVFTVATFLALVDAIPLSYKTKRIILGIGSCMCCVAIVGAYFSYEDVYYNPFEEYNFQHSQISLKSMFLGSYINIALFTVKPLLADGCRWMLAKCNCGVNITRPGANGNSQKYERLLTVHKRPKVKWNDQ